MPEPVQAGLWGLLAGSALVLGALAAFIWPLPRGMVALLMAFGAGALVSALTLELAEEAFRIGGTLVFAPGIAAGSLVYYAGARVIHWRSRIGHEKAGQGAGPAIVLGALLDGVPESLVLGATMVGAGVNPSFLVAVLISNLPEGVAGTRYLADGGLSRRWILGLWIGVAVAAGLAAAIGSAVSLGMDSVVLAFGQSFAAGAILTMLADTMFPEAFRTGGDRVGLATALGFAAAFLLAKT